MAAPQDINMPMCLKANFTLHASGTKTLKEFAFQQNFTFHYVFWNRCPAGAPISYFLAWMHNHFLCQIAFTALQEERKTWQGKKKEKHFLITLH